MTTSTSTPTTAATTARSSGGFARVVGWVVAVIGAVMLIGGGSTWVLVQDQLAAEKITVAEDARWLAGDDVDGPFSAYAQADIINHHALEASDGKTYAELDREDPRRTVVMNASFLRASLFTSVLAFGVSAMAMGLGLTQLLLGVAMTRLAPRRA
ncbi:aromatic ring-opening dioxygenase LigA [Phycicoccus sp. CSK15P-2]|uniref:aromatic ring-opening dioxygenase LigA n=1 Tax=Phycicoccus sp. CSK15P-2 TaxID=2807627 RepID=UPI0019502396|nr:aromatic ring-opening dioxygenase LigA [Phycicoccus sp. CSK15P-2]MBM6404092.1 aromatic ring-opening dioxygenase LigA [Phycicoccus sp. CSK15P-2]